MLYIIFGLFGFIPKVNVNPGNVLQIISVSTSMTKGKLEIIFFFLGFALYPDVKPLTARFKAESRAIHCDVYAPSPHLKGNEP